jgi:hypothetical protein
MVSNFGPDGILAKNILPDGKWWLFLYEWTFTICNIIVGIVGAGSNPRRHKNIYAMHSQL